MKKEEELLIEINQNLKKNIQLLEKYLEAMEELRNLKVGDIILDTLNAIRLLEQYLEKQNDKEKI